MSARMLPAAPEVRVILAGEPEIDLSDRVLYVVPILDGVRLTLNNHDLALYNVGCGDLVRGAPLDVTYDGQTRLAAVRGIAGFTTLFVECTWGGS